VTEGSESTSPLVVSDERDEAEAVRRLGDRYELRRPLGRGHMAEVFLGHDQTLDRLVAVKLLDSRFAADERFVRRFRREATAVANLNHPSIAKVYDWGSHDDTYYVVMELVEGESLASVLAAEHRLGVDRAVEITRTVAGALSHAHSTGVLHRDLRPKNILITAAGEVKIVDFGIAPAFEGDVVNLTETSNEAQSATYVSPEQVQGQPVGPPSDLYSLGVVLFEMLTGSVPFAASSPGAVARQQVFDQPPPVSSSNPAVPAALDAIVARLLAKAPESRYSSGRDLEADLGRIGAANANAPTGGAAPTGSMPAAQLASSTPSPQSSRPARGEGRTPDGYYDPPSRTGLFVAMLAVLLAIAVLGLLYLSNVVKEGDDLPGEIARVDAVVPSVTGLPEATAVNRLGDAGFEVQKRYEETSEAEPGTVFGQRPVGGTESEEGAVVTIVISASDDTIEVPSVLDKDGTLAANELNLLGLDVLTERESSSDVEADRVIRQSIAPGQRANRGVIITLTVSSGRTARTSTPEVSIDPNSPTTGNPGGTAPNSSATPGTSPTTSGPSSTRPSTSTTTSSTATTVTEPTVTTEAPDTLGPPTEPPPDTTVPVPTSEVVVTPSTDAAAG